MTLRVAEPPRLLFTVTLPGFDDQLNSPRYRPPPSFESVGQLFAWALARARGLDPARPRGLSKVTLAR